MVGIWNIPCVYAAMFSACSFFMLPLGYVRAGHAQIRPYARLINAAPAE